MPYLELKNITKNYDSLKALDNFNFSAEQNEFAVLFGSSAAGKTTSLRCISGLEQIDTGEVYFDGKNYTKAPIQGRGIAMIFQTFALYPHLTVTENLAYPLNKQKIERKIVNDKTTEITEMLTITHTLDRMPDTISGEERLGLSIGRALIQEPI